METSWPISVASRTNSIATTLAPMMLISLEAINLINAAPVSLKLSTGSVEFG
jgi:hypothetical protein